MYQQVRAAEGGWARDSLLVLYGNSVMLAGLGTELQRHGLFDLITLEPGCPDALHRICALEPRRGAL